MAHKHAGRKPSGPPAPQHAAEAETQFRLGVSCQKEGRFREAKIHYERVLSLRPDLAVVFCNLGVVLQNLGDLDGAVRRQEQALALHPDLAEAHNNLGLVLRQQGRRDEAGRHYTRAIELRPDYAEAYSNLGVLRREERRLEESAALLTRVIAMRPNSAEAHDNLGNTRRDQGLLEESVLCHEKALALRPNLVKALNNLGLTRRKQGKLDEARRCFDRALAIDPESVDVQWNKCLLDLLEGDFRQGWAGYEIRHKREENRPRSFAAPIWRGEPLKGARILLHAEQGMGDSLQFLRYVAVVAAAGGVVVLDVPSPLCRLAGTVEGAEGVVVSGDPLPPFDWHCPLMSLPLAFRSDLRSIPGKVPYLAVPPQARDKAARLRWPQDRLRIGLVWSGNPQSKEDQSRSIPLPLFASLAAMNQVQCFSLQMGAAASQLDGTFANIVDLRREILDFADTAACIAHLDLVVTVDTSVAHLAGALGKPVWTVLPFASDWRWLTNRSDSPWYPSMRLFRQPRPGDWGSPLEEVRNALPAVLASTGREII